VETAWATKLTLLTKVADLIEKHAGGINSIIQSPQTRRPRVLPTWVLFFLGKLELKPA
jgi:hypothetical protein